MNATIELHDELSAARTLLAELRNAVDAESTLGYSDEEVDDTVKACAVARRAVQAAERSARDVRFALANSDDTDRDRHVEAIRVAEELIVATTHILALSNRRRSLAKEGAARRRQAACLEYVLATGSKDLRSKDPEVRAAAMERFHAARANYARYPGSAAASSVARAGR